ncbi:PREDICTED: MADS-box transcription factor PHERES 2-like [Ipomoea nil]|uniref:MADS-box transcription factor PHERES 2-like n=1 Tax=Ipomoea nil TaxID=35883 RepID=UPI000900B463|nr:PREDICTED: MADS-box transcription factor PHERES 2-like [Ipomoea nil]
MYSSFEQGPVIWPTGERVQELIARFMQLPDVQQTRRMMSQDSFVAERLEKLGTLLLKLKRENREKEMNALMHKIFSEEQIIDYLSSVDLNDLGWVLNTEHTGWEKKSVGELMGSLHTYELEVLADDAPVSNRKGKSQYKGGNSSYQKTETAPFSQNNQPQTGRTRQNRNSSSDTGRSLNRSVQCRECEGFGHTQAECATYLKRKKAMSVTMLSDDEEETTNDQLDDNVGNIVAFFTATENQSDDNESDEESYISTDDFEERHH